MIKECKQQLDTLDESARELSQARLDQVANAKLLADARLSRIVAMAAQTEQDKATIAKLQARLELYEEPHTNPSPPPREEPKKAKKRKKKKNPVPRSSPTPAPEPPGTELETEPVNSMLVFNRNLSEDTDKTLAFTTLQMPDNFGDMQLTRDMKLVGNVIIASSGSRHRQIVFFDATTYQVLRKPLKTTHKYSIWTTAATLTPASSDGHVWIATKSNDEINVFVGNDMHGFSDLQHFCRIGKGLDMYKSGIGNMEWLQPGPGSSNPPALAYVDGEPHKLKIRRMKKDQSSSVPDSVLYTVWYGRCIYMLCVMLS
jgi:hypothetical protein